MELRNYIAVVLSNLWLIIPTTLAAIAITAVFSYQQTPIYEATATYVTRVEVPGGGDDVIWATETLMGRQRIFVTYCDIMSSGTIIDESFSLLSTQPTPQERGLFDVNCTVMPESNVLQITTQGPSAGMVQQLATAISIVGTARVNDLFQYFPVEQLDSVRLNDDLVSPNIPLNLALGLATGLVMSLAIAFLQQYLRSPQEEIEKMSISNTRFNVYNRRYFNRRLAEEINRSRIRNRPISLGLMQIGSNEDFFLLPQQTQDMLIRRAVLLIQEDLREADIVAHYVDYTFTILLPETPLNEARRILLDIHELFRTQIMTYSDYRANLIVTSGLIATSGGDLDAEAMLTETEAALRKAVKSGDYHLATKDTTPRPFMTDSGDDGVTVFISNDTRFAERRSARRNSTDTSENRAVSSSATAIAPARQTGRRKVIKPEDTPLRNNTSKKSSGSSVWHEDPTNDRD